MDSPAARLAQGMGSEVDVFGQAVAALSVAGARVDGLGVAEFDGFGSGLATLEPRMSGAELMRVPVHLCFTDSPADAPEALRPAMEELAARIWAADAVMAEVRAYLVLCARVWYEWLVPSGPVAAAWLPIAERAAAERCSMSALHWDASALVRAGPLSSVQVHVCEAQEQTRILLAALTTAASEFPAVFPRAPSLKEAEWLHFVCRSRSLPVRDRLAVDSADGSLGPNLARYLVPFLDLAHSHVSAVAGGGGVFAELVTGTVVVSTTSALQTGDQILCARGAVTNDELMVSTGIALPENVNQQVPLSLTFGTLHQSQLVAMQKLGIDKFMRADDKGRASVTLMLRRCDPFPAVLVVLARMLTGSEASPDLQRPVSQKTSEMDRRWLPTLLTAIKAQLQQYPVRGQPTEGVADIVYDSSREVLKSALGHLLELTRSLTPPKDSANAALTDS